MESVSVVTSSPPIGMGDEIVPFMAPPISPSAAPSTPEIIPLSVSPDAPSTPPRTRNAISSLDIVAEQRALYFAKVFAEVKKLKGTPGEWDLLRRIPHMVLRTAKGKRAAACTDLTNVLGPMFDYALDRMIAFGLEAQAHPNKRRRGSRMLKVLELLVGIEDEMRRVEYDGTVESRERLAETREDLRRAVEERTARLRSFVLEAENTGALDRE